MRSSHRCTKASGQLHGVLVLSYSRTLRPFNAEQTRLETPCTTDPVTRSAIPPEPSVSITNPAIITAPTGGRYGNSAQPAAGPSRRVVCIFKASSNNSAYWSHKKHNLLPSSVLEVMGSNFGQKTSRGFPRSHTLTQLPVAGGLML